MVANLCYKDTEAKLFVITEEAPVEPPSNDEDKPSFEAAQEAFLQKWQGPVLAAYDKKYPKVIGWNPQGFTRFLPLLRYLFAGDGEALPTCGRGGCGGG